jgi:hypothetical protein
METHSKAANTDVEFLAPESRAPKTELATASRWSPPAPQALTPMDMLNKAVSQGADITILERLMALQERWEANQARKAFDEAMADAKAEIPAIVKNRKVSFETTKGKTEYRHEDLAEIARTVDPILSKHGLSYRWSTKSLVGQPIEVTCVVSHRSGHYEENTLIAGRDESGSKNAIQSIGSAVTYLQRYTLKSALGLASSNDDDGNAAGGKAASPLITDEQVMQLRDMLEDDAGVKRFCAAVKIDGLDVMFASKFNDAVRLIEQRAAQRR